MPKFVDFECPQLYIRTCPPWWPIIDASAFWARFRTGPVIATGPCTGSCTRFMYWSPSWFDVLNWARFNNILKDDSFVNSGLVIIKLLIETVFRFCPRDKSYYVPGVHVRITRWYQKWQQYRNKRNSAPSTSDRLDPSSDHCIQVSNLTCSPGTHQPSINFPNCSAEICP